MNSSFKEDLVLLLDQTVTKAKYTLQQLNDYILYCKRERLVLSQKAISLSYEQLKLTFGLLEQVQDTLKYRNSATNKLVQVELELRVALQSIAAIQLYFSWRTPSYSQAINPQFFSLEDHQIGRILYERWGHKEVERVEKQLLKVFCLNSSQFACTVVSSGMLAFSLVESFLIRYVLQPGDTIVIAPHIYFECKEQLLALSHWLKIIEIKNYSYSELISTIENNNVKAVFVDVLTNTVEQRMIDVEALLQYFEKHKNSPVFVIDGTMLPCAITPYITTFSQKERVFYIESCSKYLQLGLDMNLAGVVIYDLKFRDEFNKLNINRGTILTEHGAHLFPMYKRRQIINRIARIEGNACKIACDLVANQEITSLYNVIYPGLPHHPDYLLATRMHRYGGCIVFKLRDKKQDQRAKMKLLEKIIIQNAVLENIPMVQGLSFGFSFPRITAEVPVELSTENTSCVRLYVGDQGNLNDAIVQLMSTSLKQHAKQYL